MSNENYHKLVKQNEVIISLLGKLAYKQDEVRNIIIYRKRNPDKYLNGYNACNGENSVSKIANIVGVSNSTLSPILSAWEEIGIIYEVEKAGGKFYKKIFPIEM